MRTIGKRERLERPNEGNGFDSPIFPVVITIFAYLFWYIRAGVWGACAFGAVCGALLATRRDVSSATVFLFLTVPCLNGEEGVSDALLVLPFAAGVVVVGGLVRLIRFPPTERSSFSFAAFFAGTAILLGGIAVRERQTLPATVVGLFAVVGVATAFFLSATLKTEEKTAETTLRYVLLAALLAEAELVTLLLRSGDPVAKIADKFTLSTGWGHPNYVANVILRGIPAALSFSGKGKKQAFLYLPTAFLLGAGTVLCASRGGMLVALFVGAMGAARFAPKGKKGRVWRAMFAVNVLLTTAAVVFAVRRRPDLFARLTRLGLADSGRADLWKIGWERFGQNPIFGVGFDYDLGGRGENNPTNRAYTPYWYHNTIVQILCCTGVVGGAAFVYFFVKQVLIVRKGKGASVKALGWTLLAITTLSMVDVHFFTPQDYLQILLLTVAAEKGGEGKLPLSADG